MREKHGSCINVLLRAELSVLPANQPHTTVEMKARFKACC